MAKTATFDNSSNNTGAIDAPVEAVEEIVEETVEDVLDAIPEPQGGPDERTEQEVTAEAGKYGWVPLEEWHSDPEKHSTAEEFLEIRNTNLDAARKDRDKMSKQNDEMASILRDMNANQKAEIEKVRAQEKAAYEQKLQNAVAEGDVEMFNKLRDNAPEVSEPVVDNTQVVSDWTAENAWFNDDMDMNIYARQVTDFAAKQGKSVADQLAVVDEKIREKFPEHFGIKKRKGSPVNGSTKRSASSNVKMTPAQREIADRLIQQKVYKSHKEYMDVFNAGVSSAEENLENTGHARRKATF